MPCAPGRPGPCARRARRLERREVMRGFLLALGVFLVLPFCVQADEPKKETRNTVREIDLTGIEFPPPSGRFDKPTEITSAEELARAFPREGAQAKIKKEVDFTTQKLLFFAWAGSGQDKLSFKAGDGEKPVIIFTYEPGRTKDLRPHIHLYVVPKDATVKIGN